jgi:hypothetical protein
MCHLHRVAAADDPLHEQKLGGGVRHGDGTRDARRHVLSQTLAGHEALNDLHVTVRDRQRVRGQHPGPKIGQAHRSHGLPPGRLLVQEHAHGAREHGDGIGDVT